MCFALTNFRIKKKKTEKPQIFCNILHFVSFFLISIPFYINSTFGEIEPTQFKFHINDKLDHELFTTFFADCFITCFIIPWLMSDFMTYMLYKMGDKLSIHKYGIRIRIHKPLCMLFLLLYSVYVCFSQPYIKALISNRVYYEEEETDFYERNYVFPTRDIVISPKKKKNLIILELEAFESSFTSKKYGGFFDENIIPKLTQHALDPNNIHFSDKGDGKVGGGHYTYAATWTTAAHWTFSAGLPLVDVIDQGSWFGRGIKTYLDFLKEDGYDPTFVTSCLYRRLYDLEKLYIHHGDYKFIDGGMMKKRDPELAKGEWFEGIPDYGTFTELKLLLNKFAESNLTQPFNIFAQTSDTHFENGNICKYCKNKHPDFRYLDVYACADSFADDFIKFVKTLPFYNDTVLIVLGDHLTASEKVTKLIKESDPKYERTIFNVFLNSDTKPEGGVSNRTFNTFDLFPTFLAALGYEIKGNRLGLGTNLFSKEKTLAEKYGVEYVNKQIKKPTYFIKEKLYKRNTNRKPKMVKKYITKQEDDDSQTLNIIANECIWSEKE